ncbi:MAG: hypothetical protein AAGJ18_28960, partial [Bacteroidota bacterium]
MKKFYFLIIAFCLPNFVSAQSNTEQKTTTETATFQEQAFIPYRDCFACVQGDVERAFRFGWDNVVLPGQNLSSFVQRANYFLNCFFEFEQKIATGISLNTNLRAQSLERQTPLVAFIETDDQNTYEYRSNGIGYISVGIEPRWYINKKQAIQTGKSGDNLNGAYLGLAMSINWWDAETLTLLPQDGSFSRQTFTVKGQTKLAIFNVGWQQRFLDNGFVNFKLGAGMGQIRQNVETATILNESISGIPTGDQW